MSILLFPGQGSKANNLDKIMSLEPVQSILTQATAILGYDITQLTPEQLSDTTYSQVHTFVQGVAMAEAFKKEHSVEFVAGHSLGQYCALVAAEGMSFGDALDLVRSRAGFMAECAAELPGVMIACVGNKVTEIVNELLGGFGNLYLANYNSSHQVVVSGATSESEEFVRLAKEKGVRCIKLPVAGAFHSPFMAKANDKMNELLRQVRFHDVKTGFISNKTGDILLTKDKLLNEFIDQIIGPVKWTTISHRIASIVRPGLSVYEISQGDVLAKLTKSEVDIEVEAFELGGNE